MDNQQGNQLDAAYIAGVWEADGHIGMTKNHTKRKEYWRVNCILRTTDKDWMEDIAALMRQYGFGVHISKGGKAKTATNSKASYTIALYSWGKVARFLKWILPYMRNPRKRLATKVVLFVAEIGRPGYRIPLDIQEIREWAYAVLRNLNHSGLKPSETTIPAPPPQVDEGIVHSVLERLG